MLPLYIIVLLAASALSLDIPCQDGVIIETDIITNANYMVGNWTYCWQWDTRNQYSVRAIDQSNGRPLKCPNIEIQPVTSEYVKEMKDKCSNDVMPFNWEDAKLKLNIPSLFYKDSIVFMGDKSWLLFNCKQMTRLELDKVSDDVMVWNHLNVGTSMLMSRTPLLSAELVCIIHNVDVGKGLYGFVTAS